MSTYLFDTNNKRAKKALDMVNGIKGRLSNKAAMLGLINSSQPNMMHAIISEKKFKDTPTVKSIMTKSGKEIKQKPQCTLMVHTK